MFDLKSIAATHPANFAEIVVAYDEMHAAGIKPPAIKWTGEDTILGNLLTFQWCQAGNHDWTKFRDAKATVIAASTEEQVALAALTSTFQVSKWTPKERRQIAHELLRTVTHWSDNRIALVLGVNHTTISTYRRKLEKDKIDGVPGGIANLDQLLDLKGVMQPRVKTPKPTTHNKATGENTTKPTKIKVPTIDGVKKAKKSSTAGKGTYRFVEHREYLIEADSPEDAQQKFAEQVGKSVVDEQYWLFQDIDEVSEVMKASANPELHEILAAG